MILMPTTNVRPEVGQAVEIKTRNSSYYQRLGVITEVGPQFIYVRINGCDCSIPFRDWELRF